MLNEKEQIMIEVIRNRILKRQTINKMVYFFNIFK